ncbi:DNRLRE domain-containing protein [Streptomyces phaeochromogenes]|uniref:DNRLRE domain-containing protein n=1 Tax=Streptomyces phaeochromogenes TaxID=1923 RepID=A0ABZ1HS87_STRPH|nr:DNRLRE domain-containing protein [Streptomyces phaeochromogenes]WSD21477.1 DNRLRE domain-containing protein [Streptomyces phaeochromogenes]
MSTSAIYGAEGALAAPRQPVAPVEKPKKPAATTAPDLASARVAARLNDKRVEALSERTETSTTWANPDGSLTSELSAGPVRFRDGGDWRDVDLSLVKDADGSVAPKAHPRGLELGEKGGTKLSALADNSKAAARDLVTLGEGDQQVRLQWRGGLPDPKLDRNRATYANAVPGGDVVVEATRTGFEQYVEVRERPAEKRYSYTLPLKVKGLKVKHLKDGSLLFTDRKNKKRAVMPAPVMWDAAVDKRSGEHTRQSKVGMKVVATKNGVDLVLTPDAKFLADPKTTYPVTVDPSTSSLSNVFDTYVQQGETVDLSTDTELDLGNPGTTNADGTPRTAQSFISWNSTPIQDALVTNAKLSLWNFHSANTDCKAYPWEVWASPAASTSSRWSNRPTMTAKKATSTETTGNTACTSQPDGWINADVTTLVQEWASAKTTRGHLGLRAADESVVSQWKRVNSANAAANPPKLVVNYNYRPRTGTKQEAGPPFFSYGGSYMVNSTTPTLRDTFVDADGDKVNGTFQIFDSATDTQAGELLVSKYVPSGQAAQVTVPAGVLTDGKTYKFRTSPYDGTHFNTGWSAWKTLTVDTKAPSAPTKVASTDYPADKWVKGAGQAGVFTVTPPGTDHNWLEWSLDGVTWTKVATGGATAAKNISVTPDRNGTHTLQVRSVDKADNKSEAIEYTFHAGAGGFVQPADGERTARRLPLLAEAEAAKYDKVSFSWRRSEADNWTVIPAAHVTSGGTALTAWPVPLVNGKNAALVWNATETVDPDGTVELKADFTGPSSAATSTAPLSVVVDRTAEGAAAIEVGPGSLNLLTGDYTLSATDASFFNMTVSRTAASRTPGRGGQQAGQAAIFGKEWVSGTAFGQTDADYTFVRRISDTAVDVVLEDGDAIHFTANTAKTAWIAEPGAEDLTLTGSVADSFTLTDSEGTATKFTKPTGATTWQATSSLIDGLSNSTTTVVPETVSGTSLSRPQRIIAPTSAVTAATCNTAPETKGCRSLQFVYATSTTATDSAFGDFTGQVKEIRLWSTAPGAATATSKSVQTYLYDGSGRLRQAWHPQISPSLKTEYAYDSAGRVTKYTSAGELPWTFTYGKAGTAATAGDGMLLKATRPGLKQGTKDVTEGEAATSVVYGVPLTGTTAPHKMGASDVKAWGQLSGPTDATAVFPADSVPTSNVGSALAATEYKRADIHYLGVSGREINSAVPGGHISMTEYDRFGNTVRTLSPANRALALGTTAAQKATLTDLGIIDRAASERAEWLSSVSLFDAKGTRELEEFGPLRRVDLTEDLKDGSTVLVEAGTSVPARSWSVYEYDGGRPTDGTASVRDQVTMEIKGARVRDYYSVMGEKRVTETQYDWVKGLPKLTIRDSGGLNLKTTTGYDAQGRVTDLVPPGGTGNDAASTVTDYWDADGTGMCKGRPEWADQVCWTGPAGAITGGGTQPARVPDSTTEYDYWGNPAKVVETGTGASRTTTTTYDAAGRKTKVAVTGTVGTAIPEITTTYDPANGQIATTTSSTAGTITKEYDKLGRQTSYTDADGGKTTTEYDLLDRQVKVSDTAPSTVTYTYDHTAEPRGLATGTTDSVAGTFSATYDADGSVDAEKLPGGYTLDITEDTTGAVTARSYTRTGDGTPVFADTVSESVHGQATRHSGWSGQTYRYDKVGRMSTVEDTIGQACTRRAYVFDERSNRKSLTTAASDAGAACPTTGGTAQSHTYDSADRITDSGYTYDALGRTTALPGTTAEYYTNDLVRTLTSGGKRQTWQLDSSLRFRSWTSETGSGTTWTQTDSKLNHYGNDTDNPRWIVEDTASGALSRNVSSASGDFAATTAKSGSTVLQLSSVHGDIALQLPLDTSVAPTAFDADEYGIPRDGQEPARYGWLGGEQRSAETPSGITLMGSRLYNPESGRFLSRDPVPGGNANPYEYCSGDPVNCYDLSGNYAIGGLLPEAAICALFILWCADMIYITHWALKEAKRAYKNGPKQNAYRHCIWQALLTWAVGSNLAKSLGWAHEKAAGSSAAAKRDSKADKYNNTIGRKIGGQITAWTYGGAKKAACNRCKKAVKNHKLKSNAKGKNWV